MNSTWPLYFIAVLVLVPAGIAMTLRNIIHSALLLIVSWLGVAMFFLWAGAEFVGFAQVLVYVGAVSMIVMFAVLLTRRSRSMESLDPLSRAITGALVGASVGSLLISAVIHSPFPLRNGSAPVLTTRAVGQELTGHDTAALLVLGVLLTVALIGAVVLAASEHRTAKEERS